MNTPPSSSRTKLVILGSGTPIADPNRFGPAVAVVVDNQPYLVDFGPGVVRRCAAAFQAGIEARWMVSPGAVSDWCWIQTTNKLGDDHHAEN